jgi:hypothetical protein
MVLVNIVSVMTEYTTPYKEVCCPVNRLGMHFSLLYGQNCRLPPKTSLNIYSSYFKFHALNHNQDRKDAVMCHSFPVSLCARFNPL